MLSATQLREAVARLRCNLGVVCHLPARKSPECIEIPRSHLRGIELTERISAVEKRYRGAGTFRISGRTLLRSGRGSNASQTRPRGTTPSAADGKQRSQRTARRSAARSSAGRCTAPRTGWIPPAGMPSLTRSGATPEDNHSLTPVSSILVTATLRPCPDTAIPPLPVAGYVTHSSRCASLPRPRRSFTESASLAIPRRLTDIRAILPHPIPAILRHPMAIPLTRVILLRPIQAILLLRKPRLSRLRPPLSPRPPMVRVQTFDRMTSHIVAHRITAAPGAAREYSVNLFRLCRSLH